MPGPLGVGFACALGVPDALYTRDLVDFVELTPEMFHREDRTGGGSRLVPDRARLDAARRRCGALPISVHGVELSIGSAHGMYEPCLAMMDQLQREWPFLWYSEHLHFQTVLDGHGKPANTGVPLPMPPTAEAVALVAARATAIQARLGVPFLLENPAHYFSDLPADPAIADEFGLMNAITARSSCGQLLDLHNLYCNALNFGFDPAVALDVIGLDRVGELHVAGGSWTDGCYTDAHDGSVPEPVWDLLELVLPRAPNVSGVVFEILDEYIDQFGPDQIVHELERARTIWRRHHPERVGAACQAR